jgi:hypothetical protein
LSLDRLSVKKVLELLHFSLGLMSTALSLLSSTFRIHSTVLLIVECGTHWSLFMDEFPGILSGSHQLSAVGIRVLNSEVARVHVGAVGISETKTAEALGWLTRQRVDIRIGLSSLSGLIALTQELRWGLVTLIWMN